jgi:ABC-2 type transport system permease protein
VAFGLAPVMGAVFMVILGQPDGAAASGTLGAKAKVMQLTADWSSYLDILTQAVGVGGILVFGFVASWLFGREYSDGTAKDLLALPTSRIRIINAKFILYVTWCLALVVSNLLLALLLGTLLGLPAGDGPAPSAFLATYAVTTLLTMATGVPVAFFALWGKGYLAPLGFVALILVFAQVIGATGYGAWFPWAVPGLYSGAGGVYRDSLELISYLLVGLAAVAGYVATTVYWTIADPSK